MVLPCRSGCAVVNWWLPLAHTLGMFSENLPLILFLGALQRLSTITMPGWQKCGLMSGKSSILASIQVLSIPYLHDPNPKMIYRKTTLLVKLVVGRQNISLFFPIFLHSQLHLIHQIFGLWFWIWSIFKTIVRKFRQIEVFSGFGVRPVYQETFCWVPGSN